MNDINEYEKMMEMAEDYLRDAEEQKSSEIESMQDDNPDGAVCYMRNCCVCDGYCYDSDNFEDIETVDEEVKIDEIEPSIFVSENKN